jgi:hypothetical protein
MNEEMQPWKKLVSWVIFGIIALLGLMVLLVNLRSNDSENNNQQQSTVSAHKYTLWTNNGDPNQSTYEIKVRMNDNEMLVFEFWSRTRLRTEHSIFGIEASNTQTLSGIEVYSINKRTGLGRKSRTYVNDSGELRITKTTEGKFYLDEYDPQGNLYMKSLVVLN